MEPLNKKERINFIIKFTAVFIGGLVIILIPFYFILRLPADENAIRKDDFNTMMGKLQYQKETFAVLADSVNKLMTKYDLPNQDLDKLNADLGLLLSEMQKSYVSDTSWSGRMYNSVVNSFINLKKAKNDKIKGENELKDCKQDLEKAKEEASKNKDTMGG